MFGKSVHLCNRSIATLRCRPSSRRVFPFFFACASSDYTAALINLSLAPGKMAEYTEFTFHQFFDLSFFLFSILLEGGGSKPPVKAIQGANPNAVESVARPKSVSIVLTPDEIAETKEFEERLRRALEQSRMLQAQQISQIKNIENEIASVKDDGFEFFHSGAEKSRKGKKPRKLKGILKKPKQ